jgi:putative oxidoreductase
MDTQATHPISVSPASSTQDKVFRILGNHVARALFGLPFVVFGLFHFAGAEHMAGMVPVPGGVFWVYFTGVALIAGGLGILTNILGRWAALGLAALMGLFALTVHLPALGDPAMGQMATISLLKDTALAGASLAWLNILGRKQR